MKKRTNANAVFSVGKSVFIRTVTYHTVGRVTHVANGFVRLEEASWVPDSGRFHQALSTGTLTEVEPVGIVFVAIGAVVDVFPWQHALPTEQK